MKRDLYAWCRWCTRWFFVPVSENPAVNRVRCPLCTALPTHFEGRDPSGQTPAVVMDGPRGRATDDPSAAI